MIRKAAAAAVLGAVVPLVVGLELDPFEPSWWRIWRRGALVVGATAAVVWAADELATPAGD